MRTATLSAEQRQLLERLLDAKGVGTGTGRIAAYAGDRTAMPMSFAQQRIWFFDRLQPAETIYNVAGLARLRGRLDVAVLRRCLAEVLRRHEVLRTTYAVVDNRPVQRVHPPGELELPVVDLRGLDEVAREAAVRGHCDDETKRPFDLERGPMLRPMIMRVGDEEHLLLLSQHHIATDGWSLSVLMREVSALYAAFATGAPSPLPDLAIQYGDFASWQRDYLSGDELDRQLRYWREQLADSRLVDVATGLPRPTALTWEGGTMHYELPAEVVRRLTALAEAEGATPYMALVSAYTVVLSRWSGQDDVVVGCPVANRNRAEVEGLIGCFVNELPLRVRTTGDPTYRQLLHRVREVCLGAYGNQDVPFEKIVEAVNPERDAMSHAPLVRHQMGLHNEPQWRVELPDLTFEVAALSTGTARFDLEIDLSPDRSGGITGMVYYSTDLYTEDVVGRLLDSLTTVITGAVDQPDLAVSRLPLLGATEHAALAAYAAAPEGATETVDELIRRAVMATPDAVAVEHPGGTLTYGELDERANQLAHWLRHLGVSSGTPVPVVMAPTPWQITAMVAVLKAGGAVVPLDPGYPPALVQAALRDVAARVVLSDSDTVFLESLRLADLDATTRTIAVDTVADRLAGYPVTAPAPVADPASVAFVNYTVRRQVDAGTTVVASRNTHAAAARRLSFVASNIGPYAGEAASPRVPAGLDAAPWDLLTPLVAGGRLLLPGADWVGSDGVGSDGVGSGGVGSGAHVGVVVTTAAGLLDLVSTPGAGQVVPRHVVVADEMPWPSVVAQVRRVWPDTGVTVLYGPAERATDLVAVSLDTSTGLSRRPFAGVALSIVDGRGELLPVGVPGDLVLDGASSGRRARWLPDGRMDVLGPDTDATAIRRHRVELTEVSDVLALHSEVDRAVVLAVAGESPDGGPAGPAGTVDPDLIAYIGLREAVSAEDEASRERRVFEATYTGRAADDDPVLNIAGWHSPHTGEHISAAEMREWADGTMRRILRLDPKHVLEVGCRTGPLLFRLAPRCETYTATDLSTRALGRIRRHGDWLANKSEAVSLHRKGVDDFTGFDAGSFDTVVLNALVQYFPSVPFLERVLRGAVGVLRPGGHVFMGDVRSLPLLEAMHLSVKIGQEPPGTAATGLHAMVSQSAAAEEELVLDPRVFLDIASRLPTVTGVWILPRMGRHRHELTLYRYDVVFQVGGEIPDESTLDSHGWVADGLTVDAVRGMVAGRAVSPLLFRDVPDARVATKLAAMHRLEHRLVATVGELTESIRPVQVTPGGPVDPADLATVAAGHGYDTYVRHSLAGPAGTVEVLLHPRREADPEATGTPITLPGAFRPAAIAAVAGTTELVSVLASDPVRTARHRTAVAAVRSHVQERLPGYLVPGRFVVMPQWPLSRAGLLDRAALPMPAARAAAETAGREPRTDTERAIAKIWADALGVDTIGVHDDFFALGGHSLLGAEVVEQVRDVYEVDLPLGRLFEAPTVAAVAEYVDQALTKPREAVAAIGRIDRADYQTRRNRTGSPARRAAEEVTTS